MVKSRRLYTEETGHLEVIKLFSNQTLLEIINKISVYYAQISMNMQINIVGVHEVWFHKSHSFSFIYEYGAIRVIHSSIVCIFSIDEIEAEFMERELKGLSGINKLEGGHTCLTTYSP